MNEQHYIDFWVSIPKWIVLHWPAWTWKTLFAKHISNEIDAEFIVIKPTEILSKRVWNNEKNMQKVFTNAKTLASKGKKVILFFDEADWLFEKRSETKTHKEWMISVILQEMDWINENSLKNIFVFFTTNRLNAIDLPVLSRFDKKIEIWLPNEENIIKLFKLNVWEKLKASKYPLFNELDYELLAKKTKWKSWRFIKQLMNNTVLNFAHSRIKNSTSELIKTEDIIKGIKLIDEQEKAKNKIWF
jgi:transitional endoplasmic reticulum ATPase